MKPARDVVNHSQSTDFAEKPIRNVKLFMLIVAITEKMSLVKVLAKADAPNIIRKSALSSSYKPKGVRNFPSPQQIMNKYLEKLGLTVFECIVIFMFGFLFGFFW